MSELIFMTTQKLNEKGAFTKQISNYATVLCLYFGRAPYPKVEVRLSTVSPIKKNRGMPFQLSEAISRTQVYLNIKLVSNPSRKKKEGKRE